ncbi:hypothetical protein [Streptomyces virginiae]|uniref:hypothetical protein n=1 Tax=Streptomyces virginiae TaxID=1961 RepID=UPI00324CBF5A
MNPDLLAAEAWALRGLLRPARPAGGRASAGAGGRRLTRAGDRVVHKLGIVHRPRRDSR